MQAGLSSADRSKVSVVPVESAEEVCRVLAHLVLATGALAGLKYEEH